MPLTKKGDCLKSSMIKAACESIQREPKYDKYFTVLETGELYGAYKITRDEIDLDAFGNGISQGVHKK